MSVFILKHVSQFVLLGISIVSLILIFGNLTTSSSRTFVVMILGFLYFFFGVTHHTLEKNLTLNVLFEYFIVTMLLVWTMLSLSF